jgi:hypothetical protein
MTLPLDQKLAKVRIVYSRPEDEKRQVLRAYIRDLGYCPDCKLFLSECKGHGQVVIDRGGDQRRRPAGDRKS